eukprot:GHVR01127256.1.p1 GENE.GHVR01127256.1~~GHVR01127256.1.p1  ORF type:complete len:161 (+),score=20.92 GHVR01127256.1:1283-1765(+)
MYYSDPAANDMSELNHGDLTKPRSGATGGGEYGARERFSAPTSLGGDRARIRCATPPGNDVAWGIHALREAHIACGVPHVQATARVAVHLWHMRHELPRLPAGIPTCSAMAGMAITTMASLATTTTTGEVRQMLEELSQHVWTTLLTFHPQEAYYQHIYI